MKGGFSYIEQHKQFGGQQFFVANEVKQSRL